MAQKKFEELDLKNAFLFAAALEDPETCRIVLELIFGRPFPRIKVHTEHTLLYRSDFRSLRLDVYASDEVQVGYNLEMQNARVGSLPKRSRFHQAEMDLTSLKQGEYFSDLKPGFVIFICTFDPFGQGLYRYTFEERCLEQDFPLGDETCKIFLNTKGKNQKEVPEELVRFLHYVENSTDACIKDAGDERLEYLHEKISALKKSRRWEGRYMTLGEYIQDSVNEEVQEILQEKMQELTEKLTEEMTLRITEEITQKVTEEVTQKVTEEVTQKVTEEVTQKVTEEVTQKVTEQVSQKTMAEEQTRMRKLISCMLKEGDRELLAKLGEEEGLLEQMYVKYGI